MREKIFLLGGYDLEMLEIKKLLEENNIKYFDKKLTWENSTLDNYPDEIKNFGNDSNFEIYGIELRENSIKAPSNYIKIDHHNDLSGSPSAIEQICSMLEIDMTRYLHLVAANDAAYIPGMIQAGATGEEVAAIRRKDREAQGVTAKDEELAEKAIKNKIITENITIIKSGTNRFSAITDRQFPFTRLIIYTNDELMYYGEGKRKLTEIFAGEIKSGKMFHGGNDNGYLGTAKGIYSGDDIENIKEKILKQAENL